MGKKLNEVSSPISKNKKQQFNSLIKVLKPKVYITDTSNFKRLVQELTGNGSNEISTPPTNKPSQIIDQHIVDIVQDGDQFSLQQDNSVEQVMSVDSLDSFDSVWNQVILNEEIDQTWRQIYEDVTAVDSSINHNQNMDLLACQEIESWLLDSDDHKQYSSLNYQHNCMATGYAV